MDGDFVPCNITLLGIPVESSLEAPDDRIVLHPAIIAAIEAQALASKSLVIRAAEA